MKTMGNISEKYAKLKEELDNKNPINRYIRLKEELEAIKEENLLKAEEDKKQREALFHDTAYKLINSVKKVNLIH